MHLAKLNFGQHCLVQLYGRMMLRTVPPVVTVYMFCASQNRHKNMGSLRPVPANVEVFLCCLHDVYRYVHVYVRSRSYNGVTDSY